MAYQLRRRTHTDQWGLSQDAVYSFLDASDTMHVVAVRPQEPATCEYAEQQGPGSFLA